MDLDTKRQSFFLFCQAYLKKTLPPEQAQALIDEHVNLADGSQSPCSLNELYLGLLFSAQNTQGKPRQIGGSIQGIEHLGKITHDFDPHWVVKHYPDSTAIFQTVVKKLKPTGLVNPRPEGVWPKYCRTILTAAQFLARFQDGEDFYAWANRMYGDLRSQDALPLLIQRDVYGIAYALACDFLKEKGFLDYGKPDTHVIDILNHVGLCQEGMPASAYQDELRAIALANQTSAYAVDKLIWLIGSSDFYQSANKPEKINQAKRKFLKAWNQFQAEQV